jgi:prevent-host-death family protein
MEEAISAADANRKFSRILRSVREGHSVVVTSHGRPIARILPITDHDGRLVQAARSALLTRLRAEPVVRTRRWTRDELYEDEA